MPSRPLFVLGHRNPDTDAVCAAIGYAALLRAQGRGEAVAGRQGPLRPETAYLLERFGVGPPQLVTDVRPRVADLMTSPTRSVHENDSLLKVGRLLGEAGIRVVAVVDDAGRLRGVSGQADLAQALLSGLDVLDRIPVERTNLLETLGGKLLVDPPSCRLSDTVMVGAMEVGSMLRRLQPGVVLVMGDRSDAQRAAIEFGVGCLIITGDNPVEPGIVELARDRGVMLLTVPHHTFTTLRLIQLSVPVHSVMRTDVATCAPDDLADDVRERLRSEPIRSLIVMDGDEVVQGIISRSNLLRTERPQVALVDHNERGQAVVGIEEADVVAVVDHHRVADFWTRTPPYMRLEPVGATSTIVAKLFDERRVPVPPPIAGVLLGAILTDTLLFRAPTTTPEDRRVAERLAKIARVEAQELGAEILRRASDVSDRTADQILNADFKEFNVDGARFGIGVIETANGEAVLSRRDELLPAMDRVRGSGYSCVLFAVIDIVRERTSILVDGCPDAAAAAFGTPLTDDRVLELPAILSRKKNIVPLLGDIAAGIKRS